MITLKTSTSKKSYDGIYEDIAHINQIFMPYGLKVDEVIEASQVVRYVITLPLDIKIQGKIRGFWQSVFAHQSIASMQNARGCIMKRQSVCCHPEADKICVLLIEIGDPEDIGSSAAMIIHGIPVG